MRQGWMPSSPMEWRCLNVYYTRPWGEIRVAEIQPLDSPVGDSEPHDRGTWWEKSETEPSPYPALSLALSTRDRGWYISASASGDWGGWLNARMLQFCSVKGLSLNQVMVEDAGVPLTGSYVGVMVLLYKPGLTARQREACTRIWDSGGGIFGKIGNNIAYTKMDFEFRYL